MHFDEESVRFVLLLKIVNFKLNCVRSKVLPLVKDSQFRTFSLFAPRIVSMRFEKKFYQNILEEDTGI